MLATVAGLQREVQPYCREGRPQQVALAMGPDLLLSQPDLLLQTDATVLSVVAVAQPVEKLQAMVAREQ